MGSHERSAALADDALVDDPHVLRKLFSATTLHVPQPTDDSPAAALRSSASAVKLAAAADRPSAVDPLYRYVACIVGERARQWFGLRCARVFRVWRARRAPTTV